MFFKRDPGLCPICGAPHQACTAPSAGALVGGPVVPATSVTVTVPSAAAARPAPAIAAPPIATPLGDGTDTQPFSAATYRGRNRKRPPIAGG